MPGGRYDGRRRGLNERITSQPRRAAQARGGGRDQRYRSSRNYRTIRGTDTGYNLRRRNINFSGMRGPNVGRAVSANPRPWLFALAFLAAVALIVFGITRCTRACSARNERQHKVNEQDDRVAAGVSADLTSQLSTALDQGDRLATIAAKADTLDERLVRLALAEPDAIEFVASYDPNTEHVAQNYDSKVTKGYYTPLYCWDSRWGSIDFAGAPLAVTGSGPTALCMAYFGLTGKADTTPATIAAKASATGQTDAALGVSAAFFTDKGADFGLSISQHDATPESLASVIDSGTVALLQLKADSVFGERAHWALAATENADGTINMYDPTSTAVSTYPWSSATVANATDALYAVSAAASDGGASDG